jgi:hypothetical protein
VIDSYAQNLGAQNLGNALKPLIDKPLARNFRACQQSYPQKIGATNVSILKSST